MKKLPGRTLESDLCLIDCLGLARLWPDRPVLVRFGVEVSKSSHFSRLAISSAALSARGATWRNCVMSSGAPGVMPSSASSASSPNSWGDGRWAIAIQQAITIETGQQFARFRKATQAV
jgi:hypothetical protein